MRRLLVFLLALFPAALPALDDASARLEPLDPQGFDRAAAAHLLSRAGFGGTPEEVDRFAALGLKGAVDRLLDPSIPVDLPDFQADASEPASKRGLEKLSPEERKKKVQERRRNEAQEFQKLRAWWVRRMALSPRPLEEKMTLFWHSHFATSNREVKNSYHLYLQNRTLREKALGNFKELTRAVARDPAMLRYLDNNRNQKRSPNENFARELLELFTLGIGNYTEMDIKEAARALTGWTFRGNEFVFDRKSHDPGEKTFLGRTGPFTGDEVIDIVFEQPAASRFIVRKLFAFFSHEEPPAGAVEALSHTLRQSGFEVRPVLAQLFQSAEFYSARSRANQIKSPLRLVVGTARLLSMDPGDSPALAGLAGQMGQNLFLPPNVKGWEEGKAWISTSSVFDRYNFAGAILRADGGRKRPEGERNRPPKEAKPDVRRPGGGGDRAPRWDVRTGARDLLGASASELKPEEVVDRLLSRFLLVKLSDEARKKLIDFYSTAGPETGLVELIQLVLSTPEYQLG